VSFPQLVELMVLADLEAIGLDPDPILGERRTLNGLLSEDRAFIRTQLGVHYD
jgi:GDPmannose 4,6-dehydratase